MERNNVYRHLQFTSGVYDPPNSTAVGVQIELFLCPSNWRTGESNYAACHHDVEAQIAEDNHGVFFLNSSVRAEEIDDGLSNTIFLGEKVEDDGLTWASGTRATLRNTGLPLNWVNGNKAVPSGTAPFNMNSLQFVGGFSSTHPGGANFAFGDGSVRYLSDSISIDVYRQLGHRADDAPLDERGLY